MGSFWDAPLRLEENRVLLEREKTDLINEMLSLPANAVIRRINELVKRARSVKVSELTYIFVCLLIVRGYIAHALLFYIIFCLYRCMLTLFTT